MRRRVPVLLAGRGLIAAVLVAAGFAACGSDSPKTETTASAKPGPASSAPVSTAQAGTEPCTFTGDRAAASGNADAPTRLLTDVRVGAHGCYDRVTFEFKPRGTDPDGLVGWKAAYEPGPVTEDGSGKPVPVKGSAFLVVHMNAQGFDLTKSDAPDTYGGPTSLEAAGATRVVQVRRTGDFEGVLTGVIGLDRVRPFHVTTSTGPARVIVDVGD
ncbi:MAG TPA: hypothetical protein VHL53_17465 [Acidimicrobiia bacterium]|nr:hypothetical protein [Acidimicrobiia bacterium]